MSAIRPFCVICEGKSEVSYLAILEKYLGNLFRHCDDLDVLAAVRAMTTEPTFGEFLRTSISSDFPFLAVN